MRFNQRESDLPRVHVDQKLYRCPGIKLNHESI